MPSKPAHEIVKVIGGIAWLGGLILLLVNAPLGVLVLLIAFVLSILSLVWTRQRLTDVNGSSTEPRVAPVSWLAVGVGYALAAAVFVLRLVGSELPVTLELGGAVALAAVVAVPATLALAGLTGRPVLLLPAGLAGVTSLPVLSVLGVPMVLLGIIWFWSYWNLRPVGSVASKAVKTLVVWLLWAASVGVLFIHLDPRCVQVFSDGTVLYVDAALGGETGWLWEVSSTVSGSSGILGPDVVSGACTSDIVTGWEALVSLVLAAGAITTGWLMTSADATATAGSQGAMPG